MSRRPANSDEPLVTSTSKSDDFRVQISLPSRAAWLKFEYVTKLQGESPARTAGFLLDPLLKVDDPAT